MPKVSRSTAIGAGVLGIHMAVWATIPQLGFTMIGIGAALAMTVILTALYAPQKFSDRAFRLLPWTTDGLPGHQSLRAPHSHSSNLETVHLRANETGSAESVICTP